VSVQNTGSNLMVTGSIMANGQSCVKNGTATIYGHSDASLPTDGSNGTQIPGYGGTNTGVPQIVDPYHPISPTVLTAITPITISGTFPITCRLEVATLLGITTPMTNSYYYFSPSIGTGLISGFNVSNGSYYFLPGCDGTATGVPGSFYFSNSPYDAHISGGSPTINSFNSVFFFDPSNYLVKDDGNAIWELRAPTSGTYQGIAVTEVSSCIPTTGMELTGNSGSFIDGIIDVPCANLTITGSSSDNFISGAVVGYDVTVAGSGTEIVNYDPSGTPPDKGSVLVE
jgi:hypothetical protein